MENTYAYSKHCCEFGRQCQFSDSPAELLVDIHPDPSLALNFSQKSHRDLATQTGVEMSEHEVNTKLHETRSCRVNQVVGGWPKDIDPAEKEQTSLFRNKVEKDESFINSVLQLGSVMEHCIRQNKAVDIYQECFEDEEVVEEIQEPPSEYSVSHHQCLQPAGCQLFTSIFLTSVRRRSARSFFVPRACLSAQLATVFVFSDSVHASPGPLSFPIYVSPPPAQLRLLLITAHHILIPDPTCIPLAFLPSPAA
ncbi:dynein intermediate chain 2, axonemal-like isoform X2 [Simochromis diagramma]|uniref:dynein intermediate chain 2, axonemal-like isoform X2 n=1 Tax=Simochromis diagramma TaxID=43689 RepID=UPI001A7EC593|nr:dynein intermediate chain 2, axonemal-like isoform X2 [Simochromis diagramma]